MISRILDFSLRQRLLVIAVTIAVCTFGVFSFRQLPIDVFPDPSPALVQIYTEAHGMAPEEVERLISYPIEASMFGLPKVSNIRSFSTFGLSLVNVYFEEGTDIYWARQIISPRLREIGQDLPAGTGESVLGPIATGLGLVYLYYLEGDDHTTIELRTLQDWLVKYELKSVPEVSQVLSIGGDVKQYQILIDPDALLQYDLTVSDVAEKVRESNQNTGASFITRGQEEYIVRSIGLVQTIEDLKNVVIKNQDGTPIYLSQVAEVEILPAIKRGSALAMGEGEKVVGMVLKLFGSNTAHVIANVEERIEEVNRSLPPGVEIVPFYNQASFIRSCFSTVAMNLALGIALVVFVLFLFMGDLGSAFVTTLTLPFSILLTFILMEWVGLSADLISFGGLAIAIGLIADAAIIFVENCFRHVQLMGEDKATAILNAGAEVGRPLLFAIIIIIVVFLPIFTLTGVEGIMFRPMGFTISFALAGSILFTLVSIPAIAWYVLRQKGGTSKEPFIVTRAKRIYLPFFESCRRHRRRVFLVTNAVAAIGVILTFTMGREYIPYLEEGTLHLQATLNPNISLEETIATAETIENIVMDVPEVTGVLSRIGRGEVGSHAHFVNDIQILVQLRPIQQWDAFRNKEALLEEIEHRLEVLPGMNLNATQPIQHNLDELITGVKAQLALRLYGENFDVLRDVSGHIEEVLHEMPGAADVQVEQFTGQNQIQVVLHRDAIARYGLDIGTVQETIEAAVGGIVVGKVYEEQRRFDIFLRFQPEARNRIEAIEALLISLPNGGQIPLDLIASVLAVEGPRVISREGNRRFITIQCNVRGRDIGRFVADAKNAIDEAVDIPPEYMLTWGGQFELQQRANRRLALIAPLTLVLVCMLLFAALNSARETVVILINIPLALTGGIIALAISGQYLSVPASIGFIAIFGIALEDGLVLLSAFRRYLNEGNSIGEAILNGVTTKLRPVLMTTFTTVFGILPLLLARGPGAEIWRPLATVVVGGLLTSTLVTLIILPMVFERFEPSERATA
ncbi:efflux RND transporter permease subunit [Gemmatimonadota bacterium]